MTPKKGDTLYATVEIAEDTYCHNRKIEVGDPIGIEWIGESAMNIIHKGSLYSIPTKVILQDFSLTPPQESQTKKVPCRKCAREFDMPQNFYNPIICEDCDPFMNPVPPAPTPVMGGENATERDIQAAQTAEQMFPNANPYDAPFAPTGERYEDVKEAFQKGWDAAIRYVTTQKK